MNIALPSLRLARDVFPANPTVNYDLRCDFIFETDTHVLFVPPARKGIGSIIDQGSLSPLSITISISVRIVVR